MKRITGFALFILLLANLLLPAQNKDSLFQEVERTMRKATKFMVEKVSVNGGFVW
jgi:hypothetical protein